MLLKHWFMSLPLEVASEEEEEAAHQAILEVVVQRALEEN